MNCPTCGAAVSKDSVQCQYCMAMLQTVACPACFGLMFKASRFCPHCGAKAETPQSTASEARHCPRCGVDLEKLTVSGLDLEQCPRCGGLWVESGTFQQICTKREAQTAAIGIKLPPPVPADERVRYLECPHCSRLMNRMSYARKSGVIIDTCREHGIWFDRDELRRIMEFVAAGGLDHARRSEKEELQRERQRLELERRSMNRGEEVLRAPSGEVFAPVDLIGAIASVLRILTR